MSKKRIAKKISFDAVAAAARNAAIDLPTRTYSAPGVDAPTVRSQFDRFPQEYRDICIEGALPLEYVDEQWSALVITSHWNYESRFVMGHHLHRKWEDSQLDRMSLQTVKSMMGGYLPVACPNGTYLAIKILGRYDSRGRCRPFLADE